jgi:hypothetical protein
MKGKWFIMADWEYNTVKVQKPVYPSIREVKIERQ